MSVTVIDTTDLRDGILAASSTGRAKIASNFFDVSTVASAFANTTIPFSKLITSGQTYDFTGVTEIKVPTPTNASDAVTKSYVDNLINGLDWKQYARLATAAVLPNSPTYSGTPNFTLTSTAFPGATGITVDGVTSLTVGDRILVKNQSTASQNGIYVVTNAGDASHNYVLTRAIDAQTGPELALAAIFIAEGTANTDVAFVQTAEPVTLDTTSLTWVQFSSTSSAAPVAGDGITVSGTTVSVRADTTSAVQSIIVNSGASPNGVAVKFDSAGAIDATTAGTRVKVGASGAIIISSNALVVNVDGSTIDIVSNQIEVKDAGITFAKLATAVSGRLGGYDRRDDFVGDGSTTVFTLAVSDARTAGGGSMVTQAGLVRKAGSGNDYTITSSAVTFLTAPPNGANISVFYQRTGSAA